MNDALVYTIVLLIGMLVGIFISPKGPGSMGTMGNCPYCGRYH